MLIEGTLASGCRAHALPLVNSFRFKNEISSDAFRLASSRLKPPGLSLVRFRG